MSRIRWWFRRAPGRVPARQARVLAPRLREFFFGRSERDIEEELQFHLEMAEQEALRRGLSPRDGRIAAGGVAQAAEEIRDQRRFAWVSDFVRDCRHGARLLARSPLFTVAATLSLALGIGANTAIFSLVDKVMLRSMPVREPGQLVQFTKITPPYGRGNFSYPLYQQMRTSLHSFDGMLARARLGKRQFVFDSEPETVFAELVSGNYYQVLGVAPVAGRLFDEQMESSHTPVAVISYAFWQRRFGRDPGVVGRTFRVNRTVFTIAGVTPAEFFGVAPGEAPDVTIPVSLDAEIHGGQSWLPMPGRGWLSAMGRLRPSYSQASAQSEVSALYAGIVKAQAQGQPKELFRQQALSQQMLLEPAGNGFDNLRERFSEPLKILMGTVALVLLIACANLANLLLGRTAARRREIAVRLAMGAGRGRVIRQMIAEGTLLAVAGGVLGVVLALWSANALVAIMANGGDPIALDIRPDLRVLAFAAAVSAAVCVLFSMAPAVQASRLGIQPVLSEARAGARWRLGRGLIAAQVAISVLLLVGAGLFARTLERLYSIERGFDRGHVLLFNVNADRAALRGAELQGRVLAELRTAPGVASAGFGMSAVGKTGWDGSIRLEGYTHAPNEDDRAVFNAVSPGYFRTLGTPVVQGREFDERDTASSPKAAIVNETFARKYSAQGSLVGKWVQIAGEPDRMEIVGVVKDVDTRSLRGEIPRMVYWSTTQGLIPWGGYIVRGNAPAAVIETAMRRVDPKLRMTDARTLEEDLSRGILRERIMGMLTGFFGTLSLTLVCVGVYGVMAFQVARRQKEIGIRMALGARPEQVTRMVLGETAVPLVLGVVAGIAGALALTRLVEKMLFGVKADDPLTFAGACALLMGMALAAAYLPGRKASRTSPLDTLRCE